MGLIKSFFRRKKTEYLQERAASAIIRQKARAAALKERERQAIMAAKRREQARFAPRPSRKKGRGITIKQANNLVRDLI